MFNSDRFKNDIHDSGDNACGNSTDAFRQYRAPRVHGESFVEPALECVPETLERNRRLLGTYGANFDSLRQRARKQLIKDALQYTSAYRDVSWFDLSKLDDQEVTPIIMAGHQPAIFHPGVWFKNFSLSHLAKQTGAIAVNLVIDNDVSPGSSIRVPIFDETDSRATYQAIPYDTAGGGVPYEQTEIRDRTAFDSFGHRVADAIKPLVAAPCVPEFWQHAIAAVERCGIAGCALAQARHGLEGELGLQTLELPLGVVCRSTAFAEFALSVLSELPRFHRCYNDAADHYRKAHGIRSSAHPVPNLTEGDEWFEAPFWIYGNDSPQRRPAWAKMSGDHLVIGDRENRELKVDLSFPKLAAEQLANLVSPDFKLRPRALMTTMFARLVLSDLFLHGIGGGKYDQLNDRIIESFFAMSPPTFMVISATVQLPGTEPIDFDTEIRRLKRAIRDTHYQPERFADRVDLSPSLLQAKQDLLVKVPERGNRVDWTVELKQVNAKLSQELESLRSDFQSELASTLQQSASQTLMSSREHPFCIYPLDYLTKTFADLLR